MTDKCPHCGKSTNDTPLGSLLVHIKLNCGARRKRLKNFDERNKDDLNSDRAKEFRAKRVKACEKWEAWATAVSSAIEDLNALDTPEQD